MNAPVESAICRQCTDPFRFIRYGKRPRIYCEVCRELRYEASVQRFKDRLSEAERRAALRDNAIRCHEGMTMSNVNRKGTGKKAIVRAAVLSGSCNTSLDVADETGLSVKVCSDYITALMRQGEIRRTDRKMPNKSADGRGRKLYVFEVVA